MVVLHQTEKLRVDAAVGIAVDAFNKDEPLDCLMALRGLNANEQAAVLEKFNDYEPDEVTALQLAMEQPPEKPLSTASASVTVYGTYKVHPVADLFPLITGDELDKLVKDIKTNGLIDPIVLTSDGLIADGRNRYRACEKAGVDLRFSTLDPTVSVTEYIISKNLRRRHLDVGERAMIAKEMLPHLEQEAKARQVSTLKRGEEIPVGLNSARRDNSSKIRGNSRSAEQAAKLVDVSADSIKKAKAIAEADPQLAKRVAAGTTSLNKAYQQVRAGNGPERERKHITPRALLEADINNLKAKIKALERDLNSANAAATIKQTGLSQGDAKLLNGARRFIKAFGQRGWEVMMEDADKKLKHGDDGESDE